MQLSIVAWILVGLTGFALLAIGAYRHFIDNDPNPITWIGIAIILGWLFVIAWIKLMQRAE